MTQAQRILRSARSAATAPSGWRASCPPTAKLLTLEADPRMPVARENLRLAGLDESLLIEGPALHPGKAGDRPPFDLIFIDADKPIIPLSALGAALFPPGT
jgi:tRNA A58 N-methylase Trm61